MISFLSLGIGSIVVGLVVIIIQNMVSDAKVVKAGQETSDFLTHKFGPKYGAMADHALVSALVKGNQQWGSAVNADLIKINPQLAVLLQKYLADYTAGLQTPTQTTTNS